MKGETLIIIQDHLDKKWENGFEGFEINYEGDTTLLKGIIKDEAHLHGILNQLRNLNLKLISINPVKTHN
jgi:hypothetical protein